MLLINDLFNCLVTPYIDSFWLPLQEKESSRSWTTERFAAVPTENEIMKICFQNILTDDKSVFVQQYSWPLSRYSMALMKLIGLESLKSSIQSVRG